MARKRNTPRGLYCVSSTDGGPIRLLTFPLLLALAGAASANCILDYSDPNPYRCKATGQVSPQAAAAEIARLRAENQRLRTQPSEIKPGYQTFTLPTGGQVMCFVDHSGRTSGCR